MSSNLKSRSCEHGVENDVRSKRSPALWAIKSIKKHGGFMLMLEKHLLLVLERALALSSALCADSRFLLSRSVQRATLYICFLSAHRTDMCCRVSNYYFI
jgi:hypothetical protein